MIQTLIAAIIDIQGRYLIFLLWRFCGPFIVRFYLRLKQSLKRHYWKKKSQASKVIRREIASG